MTAAIQYIAFVGLALVAWAGLVGLVLAFFKGAQKVSGDEA